MRPEDVHECNDSFCALCRQYLYADEPRSDSRQNDADPVPVSEHARQRCSMNMQTQERAQNGYLPVLSLLQRSK
jgi:hypothetical protein